MSRLFAPSSPHIPIFIIYLRNVHVVSFRPRREIFINYPIDKETVQAGFKCGVPAIGKDIEATLESGVP